MFIYTIMIAIVAFAGGLIISSIYYKEPTPIRLKRGIENAVMGEKINIEYGGRVDKATVINNDPQNRKIYLKINHAKNIFYYSAYNFDNFDLLNPILDNKVKSSKSKEELQNELIQALQIEDYKTAAILRDKLKKLT